MKLILIYGPPAVGKLTVADALKEKTGYNLFHNHLTIDLTLSLYQFDTPEFDNLSMNLKYKIVEDAAKNNINIIMTLVYGVEPVDDRFEDGFISRIMGIVEKYKGEVIFVKLKCERQEQLNRLVAESRKSFKKITDPKRLAEIEKEVDLDAEIPFVKSLVIDNTNVSPEDVADIIVKSLDK